MFDSQLLIKKSTSYSLLSPWFQRGGDYVRIVGELTAVSGTAEIRVELYTKNTDDPGDGETVDSTVTLTLDTVGTPATVEYGPNNTSPGAEGILELVRYKIALSSGSAGDWAMYRMLTPTWFDAVNA